jgi:hypothetical protein
MSQDELFGKKLHILFLYSNRESDVEGRYWYEAGHYSLSAAFNLIPAAATSVGVSTLHAFWQT